MGFHLVFFKKRKKKNITPLNYKLLPHTTNGLQNAFSLKNQQTTLNSTNKKLPGATATSHHINCDTHAAS